MCPSLAQTRFHARFKVKWQPCLELIVNVTLFEASPVALWGLLDVIMIVLPIGAFVARSRKAYAGITLIYVPINVIDMLISLAN